jgi:predicted transcriptional regulator
MAHLRPPGDWTGYDIDDVAVRLWIPQVLEDCLTQMADPLEQTKSDLARNALMLHVHGRRTFDALCEHRLWRLRRRQQVDEDEEWMKALTASGRKFNLQGVDMPADDPPRSAYIKAFGKNTIALKVFMPRPLKESLKSLAEQRGMTLSEYMRRALTAYYLGRTVLDALALPQEDRSAAVDDDVSA